MNELSQTLLVWAAAILLPMVPSFVLYKYLPSTGEASGPFKGGLFKFGGAASCYIVLFSTLVAIRPEPDAHFHTWTVAGSLDFKHPESEADPNVNDVYVRVIPPRLGILNQGAFFWEIPVIETPDGRLHFPDLQLDLRDYRGMTVPLGPDRSYGAQNLQADYDHDLRRITLKQPITMHSTKTVPAYSPSAQAPQVIK